MMALAVAGMGMQLFGAVQQGMAAKQSADYQAAVDRNNALAARRMAAYEIQSGDAKAQDQDMQARAQLGKIQADQAASGLDVNSGSPKQVLSDSTGIARLNTLRTAQNASLKAASDIVQSKNSLASADLAEARGNSALTGSLISGAGSLMSGVSGIYQKGMFAGIGGSGAASPAKADIGLLY